MIIDKLIFSKHLENSETILYNVHRHWFVMLKPAFEVGFFGFVIPWTLYFMGFNSQIFFWIAVIWSVLAYIRFIYVIVDWYCDSWLITNMNIILIEWNGIFSNMSMRISFADIEGAAYEIKGFWGTILRYGDLTLRVMSGTHLTLKNVASPQKAELALAKFQERFLNDRNMKDSATLKNLVSNLVSYETRK